MEESFARSSKHSLTEDLLQHVPKALLRPGEEMCQALIVNVNQDLKLLQIMVESFCREDMDASTQFRARRDRAQRCDPHPRGDAEDLRESL